MTADERLGRILLKVERAKKHIGDLERETASFFDTNPYTVVPQYNAEAGGFEHVLVKCDPIPAEIFLITGDIIQNLWAGLDHLVYNLTEVGGGTSEQLERAVLPVSKSEATHISHGRRKISGCRPSAVSAIDALKPYEGGNKGIWMLSRLNNIDKHRMLLVAASFAGPVDITPKFKELLGAAYIPGDHFLIFPKFFKPLELGDVLLSVDEAKDVDVNSNFTFYITLNEPEIGVRDPLLIALTHAAEFVEGIIRSFSPHLTES